MPSSTLIPDPIEYIKVVAVRKIVVVLLVGAIVPTLFVGNRIVSHHTWGSPAQQFNSRQAPPKYGGRRYDYLQKLSGRLLPPEGQLLSF